MRVVLATANPGKVAEIRAALAGTALEPVDRPPGLPEPAEHTGTLIGNARSKADAVAAATGLPALADDTGFFVDALPGELGVEAAHYGGPGVSAGEKNRLLLEALRDVPPERRTARFETVALLRWPSGAEVWAVGEVAGTVATEVRGGQGWGFDPVFIPADGDGRTFAELGPEAKNAVSHRARAFRALGALVGGGGIVLRPAAPGDPVTAGRGVWVAEAGGVVVGVLVAGDADEVTVEPGPSAAAVETRLRALAGRLRSPAP